MFHFYTAETKLLKQAVCNSFCCKQLKILQKEYLELQQELIAIQNELRTHKDVLEVQKQILRRQKREKEAIVDELIDSQRTIDNLELLGKKEEHLKYDIKILMQRRKQLQLEHIKNQSQIRNEHIKLLQNK